MGMFLNRGIEEFERAVNSQIYVDKTDMIDFFNGIIDTEQSYVCVSRPRRFGKSIAANMIAAYFEKGSDSRRLFEGRKLSEYDNWDKNMNKYDVIGQRGMFIGDYLYIIQRNQGIVSYELDGLEKVGVVRF